MTMHILSFVVNDWFGIVTHPLFQTQDSKTDWSSRLIETNQKWITA